MKLKVVEGEIYLHPITMRMPFRYGIATMTEVTQAFLRMKVEVNGRVEQGIASDILPPKWFTKIPDKALSEETQEMLAVIQNALKLALKAGEAESFFDFWRGISKEQSKWARAQNFPPLLGGLGTSLDW